MQYGEYDIYRAERPVNAVAGDPQFTGGNGLGPVNARAIVVDFG
jgi:hypothetical protein